jgi:hypothetical protein
VAVLRLPTVECIIPYVRRKVISNAIVICIGIAVAVAVCLATWSHCRREPGRPEPSNAGMQPAVEPRRRPLSDSGPRAETISRIDSETSVLVGEGRHDDALAVVDGAIRAAGDEHELSGLLLLRGNILMAGGHKREALRAFTTILDSASGREACTHAAPKFYVLTRELRVLQERLRALEARHELNPDDVAAMLILADLYSCAGQTEKECKMREDIVAIGASDAVNLDRLINACVTVGEYENAARYAKVLAEADAAATGRHLVRKAWIEKKGGDRESALSTCAEAVDSDLLDARMLMKVAGFYEDMHENKSALATFRLAKRKSVRQFRRERCSLEICRLEMAECSADARQLALLQSLAANAIADGVRRDARKLMKEAKGG